MLYINVVVMPFGQCEWTAVCESKQVLFSLFHETLMSNILLCIASLYFGLTTRVQMTAERLQQKAHALSCWHAVWFFNPSQKHTHSQNLKYKISHILWLIVLTMHVFLLRNKEKVEYVLGLLLILLQPVSCLIIQVKIVYIICFTLSLRVQNACYKSEPT